LLQKPRVSIKKGLQIQAAPQKKAANRPQPWLVLLMVYAIDGPPRTTGTVAAAAAAAASSDILNLPMICWLWKEDTPLIPIRNVYLLINIFILYDML